MQRPRLLNCVMRKWSRNARGYEELSSPSFKKRRRPRRLVTIAVGRKDEIEVFKVESQILECSMVQPLLQKASFVCRKPKSDFIVLDRCDAILFDHILWLVDNDDPSLRHLNLDILLDFYDTSDDSSLSL